MAGSRGLRVAVLLQPSPEKLQHRDFFFAKIVDFLEQGFCRLLFQSFDKGTVEVLSSTVGWM